MVYQPYAVYCRRKPHVGESAGRSSPTLNTAVESHSAVAAAAVSLEEGSWGGRGGVDTHTEPHWYMLQSGPPTHKC
jgi:hypothetical protein